MCRHELFPKRRDNTPAEANRPTLLVRLNRNTHASNVADDADDEEWVTYQRTQSNRAARISELILSYAAALHLSELATQCSQFIGEQTVGASSLAGLSEASVAAACVYVASHLRGQPIALEDVSARE